MKKVLLTLVIAVAILCGSMSALAVPMQDVTVEICMPAVGADYKSGSIVNVEVGATTADPDATIQSINIIITDESGVGVTSWSSAQFTPARSVGMCLLASQGVNKVIVPIPFFPQNITNAPKCIVGKSYTIKVEVKDFNNDRATDKEHGGVNQSSIKCIAGAGGTNPPGSGGASSPAGGPASCCKIGRDMIWKSGSITGNADCSVSPYCTIAGGSFIGDTLGDKCSGDKDVTVAASHWGMICLLNTIYGIVDWVFVVLVALAGIWIVIGAYTLLTSAGSPEETMKGRNYIMWAAIGLIAAFLARAVPMVVKMIVGA